MVFGELAIQETAVLKLIYMIDTGERHVRVWISQETESMADHTQRRRPQSYDDGGGARAEVPRASAASLGLSPMPGRRRLLRPLRHGEEDKKNSTSRFVETNAAMCSSVAVSAIALAIVIFGVTVGAWGSQSHWMSLLLSTIFATGLSVILLLAFSTRHFAAWSGSSKLPEAAAAAAALRTIYVTPALGLAFLLWWAWLLQGYAAAHGMHSPIHGSSEFHLSGVYTWLGSALFAGVVLVTYIPPRPGVKPLLTLAMLIIPLTVWGSGITALAVFTSDNPVHLSPFWPVPVRLLLYVLTYALGSVYHSVYVRHTMGVPLTSSLLYYTQFSSILFAPFYGMVCVAVAHGAFMGVRLHRVFRGESVLPIHARNPPDTPKNRGEDLAPRHRSRPPPMGRRSRRPILRTPPSSYSTEDEESDSRPDSEEEPMPPPRLPVARGRGGARRMRRPPPRGDRGTDRSSFKPRATGGNNPMLLEMRRAADVLPAAFVGGGQPGATVTSGNNRNTREGGGLPWT